jgi:hypothetical protein
VKSHSPAGRVVQYCRMGIIGYVSVCFIECWSFSHVLAYLAIFRYVLLYLRSLLRCFLLMWSHSACFSSVGSVRLLYEVLLLESASLLFGYVVTHCMFLICGVGKIVI